MPVSYGNYQKQLKLLPLTLYDSGGASIVVRCGFVGDDGIFNPTSEQTFSIDAASVSSILDSQPVTGLSRRDDLSLAVYQYLVTNGLVAAGTIS